MGVRYVLDAVVGLDIVLGRLLDDLWKLKCWCCILISCGYTEAQMIIAGGGRLDWGGRRRLLEIGLLTIRRKVVEFWERWPTACAIRRLSIHASMAN